MIQLNQNLAINVSTAKAMGLDIPAIRLARADQLIEGGGLCLLGTSLDKLLDHDAAQPF